MKTRRILKKQLATLPAKFILGCIAQTRELSPDINQQLINGVTSRAGPIEEIMFIRDFPNPPKAYFEEMGEFPLSTTIMILGRPGSYTDLHHIKRGITKLEEELSDSNGKRIFNLNPGAVGTYGVILSSHKPTGNRPDISTYAYGVHAHLLPWSKPTYYERIMRWTDDGLKLVGRAESEGAFPEYHYPERIARLVRLIREMRKSDVSVELMSEVA